MRLVFAILRLFVTEETQFCVNGGLHTDLNQCKRGSYAKGFC